MGSLSRNAARFANRVLGLVDTTLVIGNVTKVSSNPQAPGLLHQRVLPWATYSPWLSDAEFLRTYDRVKGNTLVDIYRCYELWTLARQLAPIPGDILEVGVWRGGTGCLIAEAVRNFRKTTYLADTFSGVVKAGKRDTAYIGGEHADTTEEVVRQLIGSMQLGNVVTLKGIFPEQTGDRIEGALSMVHCDVDVYLSAKDVVEWAIPRLAPGALIVFDDYGFRNCEGVTTLVNELRQDARFLFIHNLNGHAILVRK